MAISTTDDLHQHHRSSKSVTSYKRTRALVPELPSSVAWLEHTSLEMTATAHKSLTHCSTEYLLHVHHRTSPNSKKLQTWQVSRTFEDYIAFQQRLLKTLAYGHACSAECRWLHSFAKSYFPKHKFFGNCSTTTMNLRREKLIRYMNVLKSSLLNRGNHGCAIVVNSLANEFSKFIECHHRVVEEEEHEHEEEHEDERVRRCSISSSISTSSTDAGEDDHDEHHIDDLDTVCDLCNCYLDGSDSSSDSVCNQDGSSCDTTTLTCGHQFHDSCVLPQLEALHYCCPSCNEPQL